MQCLNQIGDLVAIAHIAKCPRRDTPSHPTPVADRRFGTRYQGCAEDPCSLTASSCRFHRGKLAACVVTTFVPGR
jgi:hypothetical protein